MNIYTHVLKKVDISEISIYLLFFVCFPWKNKTKEVYINVGNVNPYENKCIDIYNVLLIFVR